MRARAALPVTILAFALGAGAALLVVPSVPREEPGPQWETGWFETAWPFRPDQFGAGKAFRCGAAECGMPVELYVRAKIGFCNCATGVADDEELERIGDLDLLESKIAALGDGQPVQVAWMKGRSRAYAIADGAHRDQSAVSIAYNDRCDAIVALAVVPRDRAGTIGPLVVRFLNGDKVIRWAELTLGL